MAHIYDKFPSLSGKDPDPRTRRYLVPARVVWTQGDVAGIGNLLIPKNEQISFSGDSLCVLKNTPGKPKAAILLDYGTEINGTVRPDIRNVFSEAEPQDRVNIRIRRGESVSETMADLGEKNTRNDHANRDVTWNVGFLSANESNESGFRFVRIDLLDEEAEISFRSVNAVFIFRDLDYLGSFECSDPLLEKIWNTAAYTVHLNMQEYLWDGVKRDRLVWIGDMHTEVMTILTAFGCQDIIPLSADFAKTEAPITEDCVSWMNGMPSYSLWWLLIQYQWYMAGGDRGYLEKQREYIKKLSGVLLSLVDENGVEQMPQKFLDWPNHTNPKAEHAGVGGLLCLTLQRTSFLLGELGETVLSSRCTETAERMKTVVPDFAGSKSAGALNVLAGIADAKTVNDSLLSPGGSKGFSTFLGYYILKAKALAGDFQGALDAMREYWGGMLSVGATTFWEDFDIGWLENAARIDEPVPAGKSDIHGDNGAHCYVGFRHSLCHGWASGPCPYLSHFVLGIEVLEPGCRRIRITPHLCDLSYARGTYPTPLGILSVSHTKLPDGTVRTDVTAPRGIEIIQ